MARLYRRVGSPRQSHIWVSARPRNGSRRPAQGPTTRFSQPAAMGRLWREPLLMAVSPLDRSTMRTLTKMALLASLSMTAPASAQWAFVDGNELHKWCTTPQWEELCVSYIKGTWDMMDLLQRSRPPQTFVCVPNEVTASQMKEVVMKWVNSRPDLRHHSASSLVRNSLVDVWKCKQRRWRLQGTEFRPETPG